MFKKKQEEIIVQEIFKLTVYNKPEKRTKGENIRNGNPICIVLFYHIIKIKFIFPCMATRI